MCNATKKCNTPSDKINLPSVRRVISVDNKIPTQAEDKLDIFKHLEAANNKGDVIAEKMAGVILKLM